MTDKQTVLIAGATGNVGGAAAAALAARGVHVVLLGRKRHTLQARADAIRAAHPSTDTMIDTLALDFSDMASVRTAAAEALDRFPAIHGLVLSVVTLVQGGPNILPSGHELMFATNVMGPFLFTQLLLERLGASDGLVLHVVATHDEAVDWADLESIERHKTGAAYNRTKTMNRAIAAELARRHAGTVSSIAVNPTFVIDKDDPELQKRWPKGLMGLFWRTMTMLLAKRPAIAGEAIANLVLLEDDRESINGGFFKRDKRVKPDDSMTDLALGQRLWDELALMTGVTPPTSRSHVS